MSEMNSAIKLFSKGYILNYIVGLLPEENSFDKVAFLFSEKNALTKQRYQKTKARFLDFLLAGIEIFTAFALLAFFSPIMLLIFLGIKITSNGPGIYSQKRVGRDSQEFLIYKFRTMVQNAEDKCGAVLSWKGDPRVTRFGNFLRASHLDELPQLINIIKREMSFIGPRPERQEIIEKFKVNVPGYDQRAVVLPGITGLAQICCPYDASPAQKLKYDLYYILNKASMTLNLRILLFTVGKMLYGILGDKTQSQT